MKKLIIYVDDEKTEMLTELLEHLDFVRSVESDLKFVSDDLTDFNAIKRQGSEYAQDVDQSAGDMIEENKNIRQLRSALAAIDNVRDRNKKNLTT